MSDSSAGAARTKRVVANRGVYAKFRETLEKAPGMVFYLSDLTTRLDAPDVAIQNAAARSVREGGGRYVVHIAARAWLYSPDGRPATAPAKRMFEELATAKDGAIIIQDESGNLFRAEAL